MVPLYDPLTLKAVNVMGLDKFPNFHPLVKELESLTIFSLMLLAKFFECTYMCPSESVYSHIVNLNTGHFKNFIVYERKPFTFPIYGHPFERTGKQPTRQMGGRTDG